MPPHFYQHHISLYIVFLQDHIKAAIHHQENILLTFKVNDADSGEPTSSVWDANCPQYAAQMLVTTNKLYIHRTEAA